jgi:heme-degrading monooxygenase HmoA
MIIVVFRSRVREELLDEIAAMDAEMRAIAAASPGFIEYKEFVASDGEAANIVTFQDAESLKIWREHPRHREAMQLGYDRWLSAYDISVCEVQRRYTREDRARAITESNASPGTIIA